MSTTSVKYFKSAEQVAIAAAERFVDCAARSQRDSNRCCIAVAGGTTPKQVYELLATDEFSRRIDWTRVHLFFGDERAVPPDDPDSNYAMVNAALISRIDIPHDNIHRIIGEVDPNAAALSYENELRSFFAGETWPKFDLILLGMGEDGHTASLFPNSEAAEEKVRWVVATRNPETRQERITLTLPVLNRAKCVTFLVVGQKKALRLKDVLSNSTRSERLPAQAINPVDGILEWLVDAEAASLL
jgi:6-phosphogluconolactonase